MAPGSLTAHANVNTDGSIRVDPAHGTLCSIAPMLYRAHIPARPLVDHVEYLWSLSDAPPHQQERILPSGTLELVINLDEDEFRIYDPLHPEQCRRLAGAIVSGAYGSYFVIDTREHASVIGAHFRPGGAAPVLGVAPGELSDAHAPLDALWGEGPTAELCERLRAARPAQRFGILERALAARLGAPARLHAAVPVAVAQLEGGASVAAVAGLVDLSHRRLIQVFTAQVGMTPKLFARVRRFQRCVERAGDPDTGWSRLAAECGYADQSHMIREFIALSGFSPAELRRCQSRPVKEFHVAVDV
jgi:AraC-like DNA-binding protein